MRWNHSSLLLLLFYVYCTALLTPREFVERHAGGVYTVIPILEKRLLQLPLHHHRLLSSVQHLYFDNHSNWLENALEAYPSASLLHDIRVSSPASSSSSSGYLTICMGYYDPQSGSSFKPLISTHFTPREKEALLASWFSDTPLKVCTFEYKRSIPTAKVCSWTTERKFIEELRESSFAETLLCSRSEVSFSLLEGLTSNVLVLDGGTLFTASDTEVLPGSTCHLVLDLCRQIGLPIVRDTPDLRRSSSWSAAFLTSIHDTINNEIVFFD